MQAKKWNKNVHFETQFAVQNLKRRVAATHDSMCLFYVVAKYGTELHDFQASSSPLMLLLVEFMITENGKLFNRISVGRRNC